MARLHIPERDNTPPATKPILDNVHGVLGFVPNLHRLMANSPNALAAWAAFQGNLAKTLDVKTRDGIALAVSEVNRCGYCLAAHSYVARNLAKIAPEEIAQNRRGTSSDPKRAAAIHFAKEVIEMRGNVSDREIEAVKAAGWTDGEIVDIVALSAQYSMTNMLNNVAGTHIDFPSDPTVERSEDLQGAQA